MYRLLAVLGLLAISVTPVDAAVGLMMKSFETTPGIPTSLTFRNLITHGLSEPEPHTIEIVPVNDIATPGSDPNCRFTVGPITDVDSLLKYVDLIIDISDPANPVFVGAQSACAIDPQGGTHFDYYLRFYINAFPSVNAEDVYFKVSYTGSLQANRVSQTALFVYTPTTPQTTPDTFTATTPNYALSLRFTNAADVPQVAMTIGATARLRFDMTVTPFRAGVDFAGAILHTCVHDEVNTFDSRPVTIIDASGCADHTVNGLMRNAFPTDGFARSIALSGNPVSAASKVYVATTPIFELGAYFQRNSATPNYLYVKCAVQPAGCYSDIELTEKCSASHCVTPLGRKRRSAENTTFVTAAVKLLPRLTNETADESEEGLCACPAGELLFGSIGGLGVVAAILLGMAVVTYIDLQRSYWRLEAESRTPPGSGISAGTLPPKTMPIGSVRSYHA